MNVHPKYLKIKKLGFFGRSVAGLAVFASSIIASMSYLIRAPINALEAFCVTEAQVIDQQKMIDDLIEKEKQNPNRDGPTMHVEHHLNDEDEEWKKAHKEEYGD